MWIKILLELLTLSFYVIFMGFCFCDGFKLHIVRKLIWFTTFILVVFLVLDLRGGFELRYILPIPTLLAIILCAYEKITSKKKVDQEVRYFHLLLYYLKQNLHDSSIFFSA